MRIFSVVVEPERWEGSLSELATLLAPVTGSPAHSLEKLLTRGAVTVESDMTPASARQLCARLEALGVPAEIEGDEPELARTIADNPEIDEMLAAMGVSTIEVSDDSELAEEVNRKLGDVSSRKSASVPAPAPAASERNASTQRAKPVPQAEEPKHSRTLLGGFQTLDPDVQSVLEAARNGEKVERPPSAEEVSEPVADAVESLPEVAPGAKRDNAWGELFPGLDPSEEQAAEPAVEEPVVPATVQSTELKSMLDEDSRGADASAEVDNLLGGPEASSTLSESPKLAEEKFEPPKREHGIEAARLSRAFLDESGKPPYAPEGFDPRPDHPAAVAALMSLVAPGAGQVFNGDPDDALEYGWKAILLVPWYQSIRDAHRKGERIRSHWAPRPGPGAFVSSLKYMVAWWVCFGGIIFMIHWFGTAIYDAATRPDVDETSASDVRRALDDANLYVLQARVDGLDAVAEHRDSQPRQKFTMSTEERAERLFRIGYAQCTSGDYRMCETTMKKVTALDRTNRRAFKLQTWASMQQRSRKRTAIPDVGFVETLSEFEMQDIEQSPE